MDLKSPLSYVDQLQKLKDHGMTIEDDSEVLELLSRISYYRFTGYAIPFRKSPHDSDYIPGTSFSQIKSIYDFDMELRNMLRYYIELIEVYYRTQISYCFASSICVKPPYDQHYDLKNYHDAAKAQELFDSFENQKKHYKDSLVTQHHQTKYNDKYPLWVMTEMMTLSDLSKLYACIKYVDQDKIALVSSTGRKALRNHLHCLSVLRNKCAHAARLCSDKFSPPALLNPKFLKNHSYIANDSLFAYLIVVEKRLARKEDKELFVSQIEEIVAKYTGKIDLSLFSIPKDFSSVMRNII